MTYVISDLHGYPMEKFEALLQTAAFTDEDHLYVLGDVIDRGTDGIKLLKWMMAHPNVTFLLGNHESMMLQSEAFLLGMPEEATSRQYGIYRTWKSNGAYPTLETLAAVRDKEIVYMLDYLRRAPLYKEIAVGDKRYVLTHSGLGGFEKDKPLSEYSEYDLLWTRPTLLTHYYEDRKVIFGHTPTICYGAEYIGKPVYTPTWIDIDVGAAKGMAPMLMRLEDGKTFYGKG